MRRVLVAYATRGGGTRRQAERIADALRECGVASNIAAVDAVESVDAYAAVLIGSPVRHGAWQPEAIAFLKRHRRSLKKQLLWLFQAVDLAGEVSVPRDVLALGRKAGAIGVLTLTGVSSSTPPDETLATGADNDGSVPRWAALIANALHHRAAI